MRICLLALTIVVLGNLPARAGERYFATFYATQDGRATPTLSHTFACFVKTTTEDDSVNPPRLAAVESVTISWLPASGVIKLFGRPVPGRNFSLGDSLAWANARGLRTVSWGPYEIRKEAYDGAVRQRARLQTGTIAFKAIDTRFRPGSASNCIHAVADAIPAPMLHTGTSRGVSATQQVITHYQPLMIEPARVHPWVSAYLGVNQRFERDPNAASRAIMKE